MVISDESTIKEYYDLRQQIATYTDDVRSVINHPDYCKPFLQPGRLVHIKYEQYDFGWGAVVNFKELKRPENTTEEPIPQESFVVDVLLPIAENSSVGTKATQPLPPGVRPPQKGEKISPEVVPVLLSCVHGISPIRLRLPRDLKPLDSRKGVNRSLYEVQRRFPDGVALLDPIEEMKIKGDKFKQLLRVSNIYI